MITHQRVTRGRRATEVMNSASYEKVFLSATNSGALIQEIERRGYRVFPATRVEIQGRYYMIKLTADEQNRAAATPQWKGVAAE